MNKTNSILLKRLPALVLAFVMLMSLSFAFPTPVFAEGDATTANEGTANPDLLCETEVYKFIVKGLLALDETINIEKFGITIVEVQDIVSSIYYSEAELFFFGGQYKYSTGSGSEIVKTIIPTYLGDTSLVPDRLSEFRSITKSILDLAPKTGSDFEKILFVHDYIALHFDYDHSLKIYDAYQFVTGGIGVCQAYSLLTRYLLNKLGVPCQCVSCDYLTHEWNAVFLDGEWYNMDVTWDDRDDKGFYGQVGHDNFLSSDAYFNTGDHYSPTGWDAEFPATATDYDDFFGDVNTPMRRVGNLYYCIQDGSMVTYSESDKSFDTLFDLGLSWHTYKSMSQIWNGTYAGLWYSDGKLFWNGEDAVYSYVPATGKRSTVAAYDNLGGTAFGMRMEGEEDHFTFTFSVMNDPNVGAATEVVRSVGGYSITWIYGETTVKAIAIKGEIPVCPETPTLTPNVFDYEFLSWDKTVLPALTDTTYTASFKMVRNSVDPANETVKEARRLLRTAEYRLPIAGEGYFGAKEAKNQLTQMENDFNTRIESVNADILSVFFGR